MRTSRERVPAGTPRYINRRIRAQIRRSVARCAASGPRAIDERLWELDREWDLDRAMFAWAPLPIAVGLTLGLAVNRRFFVLPAVVATFLALYATRGWAPPAALLRRRGFRTRDEIADERFALKALRGDFRETVGIDQLLAHVQA